VKKCVERKYSGKYNGSAEARRKRFSSVWFGEVR